MIWLFKRNFVRTFSFNVKTWNDTKLWVLTANNNNITFLLIKEVRPVYVVVGGNMFLIYIKVHR